MLARLPKLKDVKNSATSRIQRGGEAVKHPLSNELPVLPKTAVMLRRPSRTRFASHESVLEAYLRTRPILIEIVSSDAFRNLYWECRVQAGRDRRCDGYVKVIESSDFFQEFIQIRNIFRMMRIYMRKFDGDGPRIYHVKRAMDELERNLKGILITELVTQERRSELVAVFQARKTGVRRVSGGRINGAPIQDIQIAAFLLDPAQAPTNDRLYGVRIHKFMESYLSRSGSAEDQENVRTRIFLQYMSVRRQSNCERAYPELLSYIKVLYKNPVM